MRGRRFRVYAPGLVRRPRQSILGIWRCVCGDVGVRAHPRHIGDFGVWSAEVSVVVTGIVAEPLERDLHVLVAEGETGLEGLKDVEVFLSEQVCI